MTKLLNRPLKSFALYSFIILLMSIPVYMVVVDYIWVSELDENNWLTIQHTKQKLSSKEFSNKEIEIINQIWGEVQPGISIAKVDAKNVRQDSVYEVLRINVFDKNDEVDRFRGLRSFLKINGHYYQISIETNVEEADETLLAVAILTFIFFVLLNIGFILLNRRIAVRSWQPFYKTLSSLQSFDINKDSDLPLPATDILEFNELNQSLHELVKNNITAFKQQKIFTENASHELQTPIALLKSKLDLLVQEKDVTPEIAHILSAIEAPLLRLTRINKNLLLLAKVENHQFNEQEELNVSEYIDSALILFEDYISDKKLAISKKFQENIRVSANLFLLETLLHNLISNAIRHTLQSGNVIIKQENRNLFIANAGWQALDELKLFQRFSSTSKDKEGSGLGLAIIKEIANRYNWQIEYRFENGFHIFSVAF